MAAAGCNGDGAMNERIEDRGESFVSQRRDLNVKVSYTFRF